MQKCILPTGYTFMEADRITQKIIEKGKRVGSRNPQEYRLLHRKLSHSSRKDTFFGLISVFQQPLDADAVFPCQELAGRLLLGLKPKCYLEPEQIIESVLETYNASIEELPWYLAEKHGMETVLDAIEQVESKPISDRGKKVLNTFRYWLQSYNK